MGSEQVVRAKLPPGFVAAMKAPLRQVEATPEVGLDELPLIRTLPVATPFFTRCDRGQRVAQLDAKPELLGDGEVTQSAWKRYQTFINRIRPLQRAEFYQRLMERHDCRSLRGLVRITGEDWSRVARAMKILELPAPILDYLRTHDTPAVVGFFTERRLRELLKLRVQTRMWDRFQQMLKGIAETEFVQA